MIGDVLQVGELVRVKIAQENLDWGYRPIPNGTIVKVLGFGTIAYSRMHNYGKLPGIYENHCWVNVEAPSGESVQISTCFVEPTDTALYERRIAELRATHNGIAMNDVRLEDLPETPLWEGDIITSQDLRSRELSERDLPAIWYVTYIHYDYIGMLTDAGTPMPLYDVSTDPMGGWTTSSRDVPKLVERGKVWKYYHNEPIDFKDIEEESAFYHRLGLTDEVRNPATQRYSWTKDEALDAIASGLAHGLSVVQGFFGAPPHTVVVRFRDSEVGVRVAAATLKGFGAR